MLGCLKLVAWREASKDAELLVLRHENAVGDPGLSVVAVCRRFAISPRLLHRLFEGQGHTFAETVRTMRLKQCARLLADPLNRSTITDICPAARIHRLGFL